MAATWVSTTDNPVPWQLPKMTLPQSSLLMVMHDNWMIWGTSMTWETLTFIDDSSIFSCIFLYIYQNILRFFHIYRWLFDIFLYFPTFSCISLLFIGFFKVFPLNPQELRANPLGFPTNRPPFAPWRPRRRRRLGSWTWLVHSMEKRCGDMGVSIAMAVPQ